MAVSHLFSNMKNSKDRQHTNFGKKHARMQASKASRTASPFGLQFT